MAGEGRRGYDGRGGIHYYRWRYGVPAKLGGRVRIKQPGCTCDGWTGVITGAGPGLIVKIDHLPAEYAKRWRWRGHPLELEYLDGVAQEGGGDGG